MPAVYARFDESALRPHAAVAPPYEIPPARGRRLPSARIPGDGLYAAYYDDGQLRHVAVFLNGKCDAALWLEEGAPAGYVDWGNAGEAYYANASIESFNPWDDSSPPRPTDIPFEKWVKTALHSVLKQLPSTAFRPRVPSGPPSVAINPRLLSANDLTLLLGYGGFDVIDVRDDRSREALIAVGAAASPLSHVLATPDVLPSDRSVVLLTEPGAELETKRKVCNARSRAGLPFHLIGALEGGAKAWNAWREQRGKR